MARLAQQKPPQDTKPPKEPPQVPPDDGGDEPFDLNRPSPAKAKDPDARARFDAFLQAYRPGAANFVLEFWQRQFKDYFGQLNDETADQLAEDLMQPQAAARLDSLLDQFMAKPDPAFIDGLVADASTRLAPLIGNDPELRRRVGDALRDQFKGASVIDAVAETYRIDPQAFVQEQSTLLETKRRQDRSDAFDKVFDDTVLTPIELQLRTADLPPSLKVDTAKYLAMLKSQREALSGVYEEWYQEQLQKNPASRGQLDIMGPSVFMKTAWNSLADSARKRVPFMSDTSAGSIVFGVSQFIDAQLTIDLQKQQRVAALKQQLDRIGNALSGVKDAAKAFGLVRNRLESDYGFVAGEEDPAAFLDRRLSTDMALELAGSGLEAGITAGGSAVDTVKGIQQAAQERERAEGERRAVAQQQADLQAIRQAHQQNPDFDLNTALAKYDADVKTGQKPDAEAIVNQARTDFAAAPAQVTAKNTGDVIEAWRQSQDFDLMAVLRQIEADPKANIPSIVARARQDWQQGITQTQEQSFGRLAGLTQTFDPGEGGQAISFTPRDVFGQQALARLQGLFAPASPGGPLKEGVTGAKLRETLIGAVNVPGAEAFSPAEIGQLAGPQSRVTQLLSSVAAMKGIDLSKPITDAQALTDLSGSLALSMRQAAQADEMQRQKDAAIGSTTNAQFQQTAAEAENKRQEETRPKLVVQTRVKR